MFLAAIQEQDVDILALSALFTTTMPNIKASIDHLVESRLSDQIKIISGGKSC
jgi:5-methyltetrahydrofolate--homocysteine methyltransferase